jgi:carbon storage regulator
MKVAIWFFLRAPAVMPRSVPQATGADDFAPAKYGKGSYKVGTERIKLFAFTYGGRLSRLAQGVATTSPDVRTGGPGVSGRPRSQARRITMLVLSRNVGQTIVIGDDICVTVVAVRGDCVRLGVTAPRHVRVDRQEEVRDRPTAEPERTAGIRSRGKRYGHSTF